MAFIDWIEEDARNSFCAFVILEAMSQEGMEKFEKFDSSNIDVQMQINGIDVDFKIVIDTIEAQMQDYKESVKKEMLEEAKQDIIYKLENF